MRIMGVVIRNTYRRKRRLKKPPTFGQILKFVDKIADKTNY